MPYEQPSGNQACRPDERQEFYGPCGRRSGVSHLRLRDEWSAWTLDEQGSYHHQIFGTRGEALDYLRRQGMWEGLPDA